MMKRLLVALASIIFLATAFAWTSAQASGIDPEYPIETGNMNVRHIYEQYQLMIDEIEHSVTKGGQGTSPHDADRWLSYINALRQYTTFWQAQATIDWAVTHGGTYQLGDPLTVTCEFKENLAACDLGTLVVNARDELAVSGSAKKAPMHLYPADLERQQAYWSSIEGFINQYMLVVQPLDEPISAAKENLGLPPGPIEDNQQ